VNERIKIMFFSFSYRIGVTTRIREVIDGAGTMRAERARGNLASSNALYLHSSDRGNPAVPLTTIPPRHVVSSTNKGSWFGMFICTAEKTKSAMNDNIEKNERAINRQIASTFQQKKFFVTSNISEKGSYQPELARTNSIHQNWRARNSGPSLHLTLKSFSIFFV